MPKVWNKRDPNVPKDAIYIGRPSKWGNPFEIGKDGTRDEVIELFIKDRVPTLHTMYDIKRELKGKDLICWCAPLACHGDYLLKVANEE